MPRVERWPLVRRNREVRRQRYPGQILVGHAQAKPAAVGEDDAIREAGRKREPTLRTTPGNRSLLRGSFGDAVEL